MPKPFDDFIMVDWSASSKPTKLDGKDSIWSVNRHRSPQNFQTRHAFFKEFKTMLIKALKANQRVLCGFDFAFGLPSGTVGLLRDTPENEDSDIPHWRWYWQYLNNEIKDKLDNSNNRFDTASEMNRQISGLKYPFWGCHQTHKDKYQYLTNNKDGFKGLNQEFKMKRKTEEGNRTKSVFQLFGNGAVGGQSLLGIPYLYKLRFESAELRDKVKIFPFENCDSAQIVIAETYYGLLILESRIKQLVDQEVLPLDKAQVIATVDLLMMQQGEGKLQESFYYPADIAVTGEEGWIILRQDNNKEIS